MENPRGMGEMSKIMDEMREEALREGIEEGRKEGIEEGRKKGIEEGVKRTARRMLAAGKYALEEIVSVSGLSLEEINRLKTDGNA